MIVLTVLLLMKFLLAMHRLPCRLRWCAVVNFWPRMLQMISWSSTTWMWVDLVASCVPVAFSSVISSYLGLTGCAWQAMQTVGFYVAICTQSSRKLWVATWKSTISIVCLICKEKLCSLYWALSVGLRDKLLIVVCVHWRISRLSLELIDLIFALLAKQCALALLSVYRLWKQCSCTSVSTVMDVWKEYQ